MKALMLKKATVSIEPGSIVEISEGQFKALGDKAVAYNTEDKEVEKKEERPKKSTSKKTSNKKKE